ncbi:MAG: hypothetical protein IJ060_01755 [Oscillospiraceae bacterium]|nr:hypothetical protein [Oscillospiraceae bacterium]
MNIKRIALAAGIGVTVLIGATAAFLTSRDDADNRFTVGKVNLKIEEEFDENRKLSAGQIITKQPWIKNTGTVRELFFAEVYVPCMEATFLDSDGQRIQPEGVTLSDPPLASEYLQTQQIYNLLANGEPGKGYITEPLTESGVTVNWELSYNQNTANSPGWVYLNRTERKTVTKVQGMKDGIYDVYLLGYSAWVEPDVVTVPIFDQLQLRSIVDADIEGGTIAQVQINADTVQADHLGITGLTGEGTADAPYTLADLNAIYTIIENKDSTP